VIGNLTGGWRQVMSRWVGRVFPLALEVVARFGWGRRLLTREGVRGGAGVAWRGHAPVGVGPCQAAPAGTWRFRGGAAFFT